MKNKKLKGISLMILVITIVIIVILAGAAILIISKNNPIETARKAAYISTVDSFKSQLYSYKTGMLTNTLGEFDSSKLQADETKVIYTGSGTLDTTVKTINNIIPELVGSKYENKFEIINGELVYKGTNAKEQEWAESLGLNVDKYEMNVSISTSNILPLKSGLNVTFSMAVTSKIGIKNIDNINSRMILTDAEGNKIEQQPTLISGNVSDITDGKLLNITIDTGEIGDGEYKLKLLADSVQNNANLSNVETISINSFSIDNTAPTTPIIIPNITSWTNSNVTASITYPADATKKEYSLDGITFSSYTTPIEVSMNNTTIFARCADEAGNQSAQSTLTIANIDKTAPTVSFGTNGASNVQTASTTVTVNDVGGSIVNASTLQYIWDTQYTTAPLSGWTTFTNGGTISKAGVTNTSYLWIKGSDNAGNSVVAKSNGFLIDNTAPTSPTISPNTTGWTNTNVTISIAYPSDASKKEYSLDGTTFNSYPGVITVTNNNTTVFARCNDIAGNQSSQSTLTIANIDNTASTYTSYNITNVTSTGYDVYVYGVSDNLSGINRVQFPTWTDYNFQDDIQSNWSTNPVASGENLGNGTWHYRVNGTAHNNETGKYQTYVYIYDNAGNTNVIVTSGASLHTHTAACYVHMHTAACYSIATTTESYYTGTTNLVIEPIQNNDSDWAFGQKTLDYANIRCGICGAYIGTIYRHVMQIDSINFWGMNSVSLTQNYLDGSGNISSLYKQPSMYLVSSTPVDSSWTYVSTQVTFGDATTYIREYRKLNPDWNTIYTNERNVYCYGDINALIALGWDVTRGCPYCIKNNISNSQLIKKVQGQPYLSCGKKEDLTLICGY
jgi:hypothetical protein